MNLTLQDDFNNIYLDSGFQENIQVSKDGGTTWKTIKAMVYRDGYNMTTSGGRTGEDAMSKARQYQIALDISTDATLGLSSVSRAMNAYSFKLYEKIGDPSTTIYEYGGTIQNDQGAFRIGLR